jgi:hypothetical protein
MGSSYSYLVCFCFSRGVLVEPGGQMASCALRLPRGLMAAPIWFLSLQGSRGTNVWMPLFKLHVA